LLCSTIPIRAAPKEQPKTTEAIANELIGDDPPLLPSGGSTPL
jgi:hypothetical protein